MSAFNLNYWVGLLFSGIALSTLLYGVSCAQMLYYFKHYPRDSRLMKGYILLLWVLDTTRTCVDTASLWFWLIQNHAQASGLVVIPVPFAMDFSFSKLTIVAVHGFFVINIWKLLKEHRFQRELTFLAVILALLAFSCGIGQTVNMFSDDDATTTIANNLVSGVLGLAAAFAADVYITAALCFVLYGRRTGFQRTENIIVRLITYAVTRGIFTALFQLAACISFGASVNTAVVPWALFIIPGNSVYVNSLMATLNVRHHVADIVSNSQNNPRENMELHNVSAHGMHIAARIASLEAQKLSGNTTKIVFSKV